MKSEPWGDLPANLLELVTSLGKRLSEADHLNFVVPNTVKRVLHIIREACKDLRIETEVPSDEGKKEIERKKGAGKQAADDFALFDLNLKKLNEKNAGAKFLQRKTTVSSNNLSRSMTTAPSASSVLDEKAQKKLKKQQKLRKVFENLVLKNMNEMLTDIENIYDEITMQAAEHVNQKDVILTFSDSDLLVSFLKSAHQGVEDDGKVTQGKDFEVLVCETAPQFKGHKTAKSL